MIFDCIGEVLRYSVKGPNLTPEPKQTVGMPFKGESRNGPKLMSTKYNLRPNAARK